MILVYTNIYKKNISLRYVFLPIVFCDNLNFGLRPLFCTLTLSLTGSTMMIDYEVGLKEKPEALAI